MPPFLSGRPAITGASALVGVLGDPVRHSLSPAMHNAALAELGLDWVYLALPVAGGDLATVVQALEAIDCRGLNVTLPHKRAVAALAAELTPLAQRLGAVNTLIRHVEGGWLGTNTDLEGFLAPLLEASPQAGDSGRTAPQDWRGRQSLVLGCGGSARAVVAALARLEPGRIRVAGRNAASLETFVADCRPWAPGLEALPWGNGEDAALAEAIGSCDLLVNTTPVGMAGPGVADRTGPAPLEQHLLEALPRGATVYDLIYTPRPTTLLRQAAALGCRTIDGLEMLVQQGAASLRLWSGLREIPVTAMRNAALAQLEGLYPGGEAG